MKSPKFRESTSRATRQIRTAGPRLRFEEELANEVFVRSSCIPQNFRCRLPCPRCCCGPFARTKVWSSACAQTYEGSRMAEMTMPQIPRRHGVSRKSVLQKAHRVLRKSDTQLGMSIETKQESVVHHQMKSQCLLRRKEYHTTAWVESHATK